MVAHDVPRVSFPNWVNLLLMSVNTSSIKFKFYVSQKGSNRRIRQNSNTNKRNVKKNYLQRKKGTSEIR